jgi:hypothetical protein
MSIRTYITGDEAAQVEIYNAATASLPGFKPANVDEVARRYRTVDTDPETKFYAAEGSTVHGYATFSPNGRISFPWCRAGAAAVQEPLLDALLAAMHGRGLTEAWAAYRGDWEPVLGFFRAHGFAPVRTMINYVAPVSALPHESVPMGRAIRPLERGDLPQLVTLGGELFGGYDPPDLEPFFFANPRLATSDLFALTPVAEPKRLLGAGVLVANQDYADPTKIDAAMPCFRLGTFGTEHQRHKRVAGLFSGVFGDASAGATLLAEAARRLESAGLAAVAAQAPSDQTKQTALYDRYMTRQGSFPCLGKALASGRA